MSDSIPLTRQGYEALTEELNRLKSVERPKIIEEIAAARAHGDLKENAEYHAAREKQGFIEGRITILEDSLSRANVIDFSDQKTQDVRFGAWVTLEDEENGDVKRFRVVGDLESDIEKGLISLASPLARAVMGKKVDDDVTVKAPKGEVCYIITDVSFSP